MKKNNNFNDIAIKTSFLLNLFAILFVMLKKYLHYLFFM